MAGIDTTKVLNFSLSKLEIGLSADHNTPSSFVDLGLADDETLKLTASPIARRGGGGESVQGEDDITVEVNLLQVKDQATIQSTYKNKNCWLQATAKDGTVLSIKNILPNFGIALELYAKGKSAIKLTATTSDVYANVVGIA